MAQYTRGRATVAVNSLTVTGTDTVWFNNVSPGDVFKPKNQYVYGVVANIVSDTVLTLNSEWLGGVITNSEYQITRDFTAAFGFYEINPGDVNWAYYITQNLRKIDSLFAIMQAGTISAEIFAARDTAVTAIGNVDASVLAAAGSATAAEASAVEAEASAMSAADSMANAEESATAAATSAAEASASASSAIESADTAIVSLAITNYLGNWSDLSGAATVPASVSYNGLFWKLLENVTDITTQIPGTSSVWESFNLDIFKRVISSSGCNIYDSVASVVADTTLVVGDSAQTISYFLNDNGGGGMYKIVAEDTGSANGYTYINLNNGLQMALVSNDGCYYAKQAGIRTTTNVDDTNDVARALSLTPANSVFVFDPGFTYNINTVTALLTGVKVIIAYGAIFNCLSKSGIAFNLIVNQFTDAVHLKWYGGILRNEPYTSNASVGILVDKCHSVVVEDVSCSEFYEAIRCTNSHSVSIDKNNFDRNARDAVLINCKSSRISKNSFINKSANAIVLNDCDNTSIGSNNFAQTVGEQGHPITIDSNCTKTHILENAYVDAPIIFDCPRSEISCWPYRVSLPDVVPVPGYNGNSFSTVTATINMSSFFPSHIKPVGYDVIAKARDSGCNSSQAGIFLYRNAETPIENRFEIKLGGYGLDNDQSMSQSGYVPANTDGNISINCVASGSGTLDVWLGVVAIYI